MMDGADAFLRRKVESLLAEHRENDGSGSPISSPNLILFVKKEAVGYGRVSTVGRSLEYEACLILRVGF